MLLKEAATQKEKKHKNKTNQGEWGWTGLMNSNDI